MYSIKYYRVKVVVRLPINNDKLHNWLRNKSCFGN